MALLMKSIQKHVAAYRDRRFEGSQEEYEEALRRSTTVYVGNLSFFTTEEQMHELFSKCGEVRKIIVGLDKNKMTPCGFAFVEYYNRVDTERCVNCLNNTSLDERLIRIDIDWGFMEGRQFGRGRSGGQVRDEYRTFYDSGRGGYGKIVEDELKKQMMGVPEEPVTTNEFTPGGGGSGGGFDPKGNSKRGRDEYDEPMRGTKDYMDDRKRAKTDNPRFREQDDNEDD